MAGVGGVLVAGYQPHGQQPELVGVGVDRGQFFTGRYVPSRCLHLGQGRDAVDAHGVAVDEIDRFMRGQRKQQVFRGDIPHADPVSVQERQRGGDLAQQR